MNKLQQVAPISSVWAISDVFANYALPVLEAMDVVECAKHQEAHDARLAAQIEAGRASRMERGEPEPKPYQMAGDIAVLSITGPITKKPTSASWLFGGASSIQLRSLLRAAEADKDVSSIAMVWETPGGEVAGLSELADQMRETNAVKPIVSYFDDQCASAGYYCASQSSAIYMNRMGWCGCIGTVWGLQDSSARAAQQGIKIHLLKTGAYKGAGTAGTAIEPHHLAHFQHIVDTHGEDFLAQIVFGRGMAAEDVASIADGRMFSADEALALGLIDGICSFEQCLETISSGSLPERVTAASNGTTGEPMENTKPGFWEQMKSLFQSHGIDPTAEGGQPPASAMSVEDLAKIEEGKQAAGALAIAESERFADSFVKGEGAKAAPAERDAIARVYLNALNSDGLRIEAGKIVEGENAKAVRTMLDSRPTLNLTKTLMGSSEEEQLELNPEGGKATTITPARRKELLGKTATGRSALAQGERK